VAKKKRNYREEYDDYHGTKDQRERRSSRNKARRKVKCVAGKEVDHKDMNPRNNSKGNLACVAKKTNRKKQPKRT
jgi:hypothetical protein